VLNQDIRRNLLQFTGLSLIIDLLPIGLRLQLDRFDAELPRAFDPCLFFHAIWACAIVPFDYFKMGFIAMLLQSSKALLLCKVKVELYMRCTVLSLL